LPPREAARFGLAGESAFPRTPSCLERLENGLRQQGSEQRRWALVRGPRAALSEQTLALGDDIRSDREVAALVTVNVDCEGFQDVGHGTSLRVYQCSSYNLASRTRARIKNP